MALDPIEITGGLAIGTGLGGAIVDTVEPRLRQFKFEQSGKYLYIPLSAGQAAQVAAENYDSYGAMQTEAANWGYDPTRFQHLYDITVTGPGMGELLNMLRRGTINPGNFTHGLRKARLEPMWDDALAQLAVNYIGLGDIATAIVRGAVPAPAWVPVAPPTHTDNVPRFPVTDIDPIALAAKLGYSEDMLRIMTARSGLSLAPILATQAFFRGALTQNDWLLAIAEGDLRTEWAETLKAAARQIPTSGEIVENHLRGWTTAQEMYNGTARHGMSQADTDLVFQTHRRPLSVATITKALARGGQFNPAAGEIQDPYSASVHQANLGPEWYDLGEHMRYTYPSAFVLRALLKDGAISATEASTIMQYEGYPPKLADTIAAAYAPSGGTVADPHITKAQTTAWSTAQRSYIAEESTAADVQPIFNSLGIPGAAQTQIVNLWDEVRALVRKQLTPAQVKKAWSEGATNPATGQPWTQQEAIDALLARGYSPDDAATLLEL